MSVTRILTFTSLYPTSNQPSHGVFVEQRLRHLVAGGEVEAKVVAPVPWFPWSSPLFGKYADYAGVPYQENLHGIDVRHPRYPVIPKVGMLVAPLLMVASLKHVLKELLSDGFDFDLLDAHFLYPDGVAAILLGRLFGRPVVLTARGTDVHTYLDDRLIRPIILWAVRNAARTITVSEALRKMLLAAGIAPDAVVSLRNGVDLNLFQRGDKALNRSALGINGRTVLSVGNLRKVKGHDLVIEAISMMEDVNLIVIGAGEEDQALRALVDKLGLGNRVRFIQPVSHRKLREYYVAADALVLASEKEGWPQCAVRIDGLWDPGSRVECRRYSGNCGSPRGWTVA